MWPLARAENKITRRKKHDFKYMPNIMCRQGYKAQYVPLGHYHDAKCFPAKIAAQIHRCDQLRNIRTENRASKSVTRSRRSTDFSNSHLCWLIGNWFSRSCFYFCATIPDHWMRKIERSRRRSRFKSPVFTSRARAFVVRASRANQRLRNQRRVF